jgi:transcriptional regulator with XRE-family HTH domain
MEQVYSRQEAFETLDLEKKMSDAELIRRTGLSRQMLYKWRKGTARIRPYHLMSFANAVGKVALWKDKNHETCSLIPSKDYDVVLEKESEYVYAEVKTYSNAPKDSRISMHSTGDWVLAIMYDVITGEILSKKRYRTHDFEYDR